MSKVIEVAKFKLNEGVDVEVFLQASEEFNANFVSIQSGYITRNLVQENDVWADIVEWESMEDAVNCGRAMSGNGHIKNYMVCMKMESVEVNRFTAIRTYMK
ncbi:hypothetical protein [Paenibacillus glacialis]|uniref:ABM domain-containing protein n=1 Tax=Paenibacillus glacialis TaxID=494026 RepID=A0A162LUT7_9BACL|nr:hypothetical protein [Paenibacillus glacialis]OAB40087.1 hypothetical protein PGLA_18160 [Paenibacillus glacialis]